MLFENCLRFLLHITIASFSQHFIHVFIFYSVLTCSSLFIIKLLMWCDYVRIANGHLNYICHSASFYSCSPLSFSAVHFTDRNETLRLRRYYICTTTTTTSSAFPSWSSLERTVAILIVCLQIAASWTRCVFVCCLFACGGGLAVAIRKKESLSTRQKKKSKTKIRRNRGRAKKEAN